jgi:hypothetical protein
VVVLREIPVPEFVNVTTVPTRIAPDESVILPVTWAVACWADAYLFPSQAGVFVPEAEDGSANPFSVGGQRSESMTFLIDGADDNDFLGNNMVVDPNPDALAEFKILTNNYEAEYGRTSGGIINSVIKSGTNNVHGSLFEFFRNTALDASDYFLTTQNPDGTFTHHVPDFKRNAFGGTIGFPIKRNKAFFFASYQGIRRREGQIAPQFQTLSPAERTGDFSELLPGTQLVNPIDGTNYVNNQVPVDPVIANYIAKYVPLPNAPNSQFLSAPDAKLSSDQFDFRFDYNLSSNGLRSRDGFPAQAADVNRFQHRVSRKLVLQTVIEVLCIWRAEMRRNNVCERNGRVKGRAVSPLRF